ncbi:MAG: DUF2071 domain-containing protein [Ardenticatenaceae bacterium]|nr:DUF2071 domain-containing protein [Anaerolineales bacterium]MCB8976263.1 DUF2071 domain-containing protein [Ardenticatenaceae bacterium]
MAQSPRFLTAVWRYLVMLNYHIDPAVLRPLVPQGTELDSWQDQTFVSIVGFMFQDTRLLGLAVPHHIHFEELNLRFYVRRQGPEGWRRGVVFVKELVPRWAIATTARLVYNENYAAVPMRHDIVSDETETAVSYSWRWQKTWHSVQLRAEGQPQPLRPGSQEEFITEHYWGYARQRDGGTVEYQVEHPPWNVWQAADYRFDCDVAALYGPMFAPSLQAAPASAFLADGSAVTVRRGIRIH